MREIQVMDELKCPKCGGVKFQLGPQGGLSQNIRCKCGQCLNVTRIVNNKWWVEDIGMFSDSNPQ